MRKGQEKQIAGRGGGLFSNELYFGTVQEDEPETKPAPEPVQDFEQEFSRQECWSGLPLPSPI